MYYFKRYLQFNDLVFDGYDMISDYNEPVSYKGSSMAYSYGHGSYMPYKTDYLYVSERQVSMTITLKLKKLPCEYREFYVRFAEQELSKPGKLWAVKNNEIIWAIAKTNNIRPVISGRKDEVVFDVEFVIPGGVWHKADRRKTFMLPYNVCAYMECKGFAKISTCFSPDNCCSDVSQDNKMWKAVSEDCVCCCDEDVTSDMALCFHQDKLQNFYGCETPFQLKYDCLAADRFNEEPAFGQKFMNREDACEEPIVSGRFYSDTDIPTEDMTITLIGDMLNPSITINNNTNIIKGEYHGTLVVHSNGDVEYSTDGCCIEAIEPSKWEIPSGMNYGWTIYPNWNGITVNTNLCCVTKVYIDHTAITL